MAGGLPRRVIGALLWAMAVAHVVEAVELRRRRRRVTSLHQPSPHPGDDARGKVDVVAVSGAVVDDRALAAVRADMEASGAEVVDLVPGDLPIERALRLLRRVQPERLGTDAFYTPGGAHEVVALHPTLTARMDPGHGTRAKADGTVSLDRGQLVRQTLAAQRHAPTAAAMRVTPGVRAAPATVRDRWRELQEITAYGWPYGSLAPILVGLETLHLAAMTAGLLLAPPAAAAALATWSAQPALVFGLAAPEASARSFVPPDRLPGSVLRLPRAWAANLRTAWVGYWDTRLRETLRAGRPVPVPPATETLFEPRRATCAWCGSAALEGRLDVTDLVQHKPGTFHLDECRDCGHIFQNPALTPAGLDYYYQDFYEGLGEELTEVSFAALAPLYRRRVESLARFAEPTAWLDVGTGHGHFCLAARERWPEAIFDGLDMSETVEEAQRRGRIDTAHRGTFPELAGRLPRSYDVMSMHHYLEHTRDPRRELAAAATVLQPGGHLMIEMPDPASPWSRRLGRYWWQWGQPQHQHFVTCDAMVAALEGAGFEVLSVERGEATFGGELFNAVGLVLQRLARSPHLPWLPAPSLAHRVARPVLFAAALPVMAATKMADGLKDARLRRPGSRTAGNAYRLIARRI